MQSTTWHYPHDFLSLMIDTIPLLVKGKLELVAFFRGAGVSEEILSPIRSKIRTDRSSVSKYEIAREVLHAVNDLGPSGLTVRREIVKRVVEFQSFEKCYDDKAMAARGGVQAIRKYVYAKDTVTRLAESAEKERSRSMAVAESERERVEKYRSERAAIKADFYALFSAQNAWQRGKLLEAVLNRLFKLDDVLVKEAFTLRSHDGKGIVEQIDASIEVHNFHWLVEAKWWSENIGTKEVAQHVVRVSNRGGCAGMFIVYPGYSDAARETVRDALRVTPWVLCDLEEIVQILEADVSVKDWLKPKVDAALDDRTPYQKFTP